MIIVHVTDTLSVVSLYVVTWCGISCPSRRGEIIQALSCVLIHHSPQESGVTRHWADRVAMWGLETVDWNIDLDMGYEMVRW